MRTKLIKSLGTKLFLIMGFMVFLTVTVLVGRYTVQFRTLLKDQIFDKNISQAENALSTITSQIRLWQSSGAQALRLTGNLKESALSDSVEAMANANEDFLGVHLIEIQQNKTQTLAYGFTNKTQQQNFEAVNPADLKPKIKSLGESWAGVLSHNSKGLQIRSLSTETTLPTLQIAIPASVSNDSTSRVWVVLTVWAEPLLHALVSDTETKSFLMDVQGNLLASRIKPEALGDIRTLPISSLALSGKSPSGQKEIQKPDGSVELGAFASSADLPITIVVLRNPEEAFAIITKELFRSILLALVFLLLVILVSYIAAGQVTKNLRKLTDATQVIAAGDFQIQTDVDSEDEVGELGRAIGIMSRKIEALLKTQVETARQEKELVTTRSVQQTLFPREDIKAKWFQITGDYRSASECGGDWWGHFEAQPNVHFLCVADATGHGAPAALVTAMAYSGCMTLSNFYTDITQNPDDPDVILLRLNQLLCQAGGTTTMTFFASFVNFNKGTMIFANAGHNMPYLVPKSPKDPRLKNKKGEIDRRAIALQSKGMPLGIAMDSQYTKNEIQIRPGDKLVLFTDGLIECKNPSEQEWGKKRLQKNIEENADKNFHELKALLIQEAFGFFGEHPLDDDVTIVTAEISDKWAAPK